MHHLYCFSGNFANNKITAKNSFFLCISKEKCLTWWGGTVIPAFCLQRGHNEGKAAASAEREKQGKKKKKKERQKKESVGQRNTHRDG